MPFILSTEAPKGPTKYTGELCVLNRLNKREVAVEIWLMREGPNENRWDFQNLEKHYKTFCGQPILCAYVYGKIGDGHNMRKVKDPVTGAVSYTFTDGTAERIVGTISEDPEDLKIVEQDGQKWLVARGKLFAFYAPELTEKIIQTGRMSVSVELDTIQEEDGQSDGILVITDWTALGVTVLGDDVAPAIPGAKIRAIAALRKEFNEVKCKAAALAKADAEEQNQQNKPPKKGVKRSMNKKAAEALAPKFEGYRIVALSEDGMNVGLVDASGGAFTYRFLAEDKGEVVPARITPYHLTASFSFGEDSVCEAEVSDIADYCIKSASTAEAPALELQEKLTAAEGTIKALQEAEHTRRLNDVTSALDRALSDIKTCAAAGDADLTEFTEGLKGRAEEFSGMVTDGKFCGAEHAVSLLMAEKGRVDMERRRQEMAALKHDYAWGRLGSEGGDTGKTSGAFSCLSN